MARQNTLPTIDGTAPVTQPARQEPPVPSQAETPIAESYMARRVDVKLPLLHRRILRDKMRILQDAGARLQDGTEVTDKTKTVLWILENEVDLSAV